LCGPPIFFSVLAHTFVAKGVHTGIAF